MFTSQILIEYLHRVETLVHEQHLLDALAHVLTGSDGLEIVQHLASQLLLAGHLSVCFM